MMIISTNFWLQLHPTAIQTLCLQGEGNQKKVVLKEGGRELKSSVLDCGRLEQLH